jgi:hypothetical protein
MFLDIHAHSTAQSIFIYAPFVENEEEMTYVKRLPEIMH